MDMREALVGTRVRCNRSFYDVPIGTEGIIDEHYGTGVMVAWDRPAHPLPEGYLAYDGVPTIRSGILRDGFDASELEYLSPVVREK